MQINMQIVLANRDFDISRITHVISESQLFFLLTPGILRRASAYRITTCRYIHMEVE